MQKLDGWFKYYNTKHPHSALNLMYRQKQKEDLTTLVDSVGTVL